jgi:tetratricopeptide (TPR) repeat protein
MTREAVIFGISGTFFGLLVGWIIGSQQGVARTGAGAPAVAQAAPASPGNQQAPPPLDLQRVSALEQQAKTRPADAAVRAELGNVYFDAERFDQAIPWYEAALKLNPKDINVSTDLAVCYYYTNDADRALVQIGRSLAIDPRHAKTLLNQGIIRAFGKQDLAGALESWELVVTYAPDSPEAARARQGIDGLKSAHATDTGAAGAGRGAGSGSQ